MTSLATTWQQSPGSPSGACHPEGHGAQFGGGGGVHPDGGGQLHALWLPSASSGQEQAGIAGHAIASAEVMHAVSVLVPLVLLAPLALELLVLVLPPAVGTAQQAAPD